MNDFDYFFIRYETISLPHNLLDTLYGIDKSHLEIGKHLALCNFVKYTYCTAIYIVPIQSQG